MRHPAGAWEAGREAPEPRGPRGPPGRHDLPRGKRLAALNRGRTPGPPVGPESPPPGHHRHQAGHRRHRSITRPSVTRTTTRSSSTRPPAPPPPGRHHQHGTHVPREARHHQDRRHRGTRATVVDVHVHIGPAPRGPRPRHHVSQSTEAASQSTTPPAGHRTSEGIARGRNAPQGRTEPQGGSGRQQVHHVEFLAPSDSTFGGNLHMEMKATTRTTHQQVQSQDRHQAVRTPPGPRHGWRSGIGATTGHRRATGLPIEAEATTRPATTTRPPRRRRSPGPRGPGQTRENVILTV